MAKVTLYIGQPCPVCGTPAIAGKNGAYCKPCYIKWKNSQASAQPQTPPADHIKEAQDRKAEFINGAQDRKEAAVKIEGSKSGAARIVAAMINVQEIPAGQWQEKYREVANWIYNFEPAPFK